MASESRQRAPITDPHHLLSQAKRRPGLSHLQLSELVSLVTGKATLLARKEMELARTDAETDLRQEAKMATGLGIGGVCALLTLVFLLVAVVFGLIEAGLPGWGASLVVAAAVLVVGTIATTIGWKKRVREPMAATRRSLSDGVTWAKTLR